ncbi:type VII secretion protein EccB [Actinoallomurus iriomotensis]|uniref:Type VII secretion protein EccB n=1 Tax=Actinoallomurus iriomotensis TaxID=478107 RepID=A0A9W6VJ87_9ACTN|nr:type VII secretion protein EccB [Actinoallomurus iriomotensis]GLY73793.1 type VII secretion protein EccB [Actinoallomurus iriomotensis]
MQSRRDQVQAHLFVMGRLASAMLRADPDAPDAPTARTNRGARIGIAVAVAMAVIVAIYGLIKPGGRTDWRKPGTLVVVKESGARFLYLGGALRPVLNETSARLLAGDRMSVVQVHRSSLSHAARGAPVGLVGAPDELPDPAALTAVPWLACGTRSPNGSGGITPRLTLLVGPTAEGTPLTAGEGVLVGTPDGAVYLLWRGFRMRLDQSRGAVQALGYADATAYPVSPMLLNALPAGPDLTAPPIQGRGRTGPSLAGRSTRVGQLFAGPGGHYVLTESGLVPLSGTLFALLRGAPGTQRDAYRGKAVTPAAIGPQDVAAHEAPGSAWFSVALPADPPGLVTVGEDQGVCADVRPSAGRPTTSVTLLKAAAESGGPPAAEPGVLPACTAADRIGVRPGGGSLVRALSGGGAGQTEYLVTGAGVKYPLPSADAAGRLGYGAAPVAVPDGLLRLLPTGPSLDPATLARNGVVGPPAATVTCG